MSFVYTVVELLLIIPSGLAAYAALRIPSKLVSARLDLYRLLVRLQRRAIPLASGLLPARDSAIWLRRSLLDNLIRRLESGEPLSEALRGARATLARVALPPLVPARHAARLASAQPGAETLAVLEALTRWEERSLERRARRFFVTLPLLAAATVLLWLSALSSVSTFTPSMEMMFGEPIQVGRPMLLGGLAIACGLAFLVVYLVPPLARGIGAQLPFFGGLLRQRSWVEVGHQLAARAEAGLPLPDACRQLAAAEPSPQVRQQLEALAAALEAGEGLSTALAELELPDSWRALVTLGALGGDLGGKLRDATAALEAKLAARLERLELACACALTVISALPALAFGRLLLVGMDALYGELT